MGKWEECKLREFLEETAADNATVAKLNIRSNNNLPVRLDSEIVDVYRPTEGVVDDVSAFDIEVVGQIENSVARETEDPTVSDALSASLSVGDGPGQFTDVNVSISLPEAGMTIGTAPFEELRHNPTPDDARADITVVAGREISLAEGLSDLEESSLQV